MVKPKALLLGKIDQYGSPKHGDPIAACLPFIPEFLPTDAREYSAAAQKEWDELAEHAELVLPKASNREEFIEECKRGDLDGVVVIYRTFDSAGITGLIDHDLLDALPKSVRFICHNGAGYDSIDVAACTAHKIHVANVPKAVDNATADTAVFLIISTLRNFPESMAALRRNEWRGKPEPAPLGHDPEGKVLGIVGMGGIGRNLATKMRVFGMKIQYHNRRRLPEKEEEGAKYVSFEELLKTSDVISLNLPLNPKTKHIISHEQFNMMKPTAILVNTARGGVIDEAAMVKALDEGKIANVGLDVYEEEPKVHQGLIANEKVTLLPHMGTSTVETATDMEKWCIRNVRSALTQGVLTSRVPEQDGEPY